MRPELPYALAGGLTIVAAVKREGKFPSGAWKSIAATAVLVLIASLISNTKAAPIVNALGIALVTGAAFNVIRVFESQSAPKLAGP